MSVIAPTPTHLPKRLTISFPIWGLYDTAPGGAYHDLDRMMEEHVARGFNCIRLDDAAGLMHDRSGNPLPPIHWGYAFGEYDKGLRQFGAIGNPGLCDVRQRLIDLFAAAKRHGVYIILSSWYYLHTCWYCKDHDLNDALHAIAPVERFRAFAEFLHYIILELKERNLISQLAFAEIFNEADGLRFVDGYGNENHLSDEEIAVFRKAHEDALAWLQEQHPDILFAFDSWTYYADLRQVPRNMQVYNFHNYFLWSVYSDALENDPSFLLEDPIPLEDIVNAVDAGYPPTPDWNHRAWFYSNLDPARLPMAQEKMARYLREHMDDIRERFRSSVDHIKMNLKNNLPQVPVVCGEGVSYNGAYSMIWEETSPEYWQIMAEAMAAYRDMGLWGTVVRTCCGPEDPVWTLCPDKLLEMNRIFLGE